MLSYLYSNLYWQNSTLSNLVRSAFINSLANFDECSMFARGQRYRMRITGPVHCTYNIIAVKIFSKAYKVWGSSVWNSVACRCYVLSFGPKYHPQASMCIYLRSMFFHSGERRKSHINTGNCLIFKWLLHRGNKVADSQVLFPRNLNQLNAVRVIMVNSSITVPLSRSLSEGFPLQFIPIITPAVVYSSCYARNVQ
jgi:hypothetical protein